MAERPPILERLHDALVVLLIVLRPLCWDGAPGQAADLLWQLLAVGALGLVAIERAAGLLPAWRWSWRASLVVVLLLALLPAVFAAPEPAPAWCRWTGWVACAAAAGYLMQVIDGRHRLALSACAGVVAIIGVLALMQRWVGLPAMAAAQSAGAQAFAALPVEGGQVAERIARGGVFATFTLANQLGAWLALVLPLVGWLAWRSTGAARWAAAVVLAMGLVALASTGAKGAWLACAGGLALAWWLAWAGRWWRWLPLPLAAVAVVGVWWSGVAAASVEVRIGYWRSAAALVAEAPWAGHGLGGFAAHQPRLMQPGDEPTRFVHNEVLEAAVAGGLPVAILLAGGLIALAWPRRSVAIADEPAVTWQPWIIVPALLYIALLGAMDGNLGWWPGGDGLTGVLAWSLLLGAVGGGVAWSLRHAPLPPPWVATAGLAAVACKALIDFDLHAAGVVGSAMLFAVILAEPAPATSAALGRILPAIAAAAAGAVVLVGSLTGQRLSEAADWLAQAQIARADPQAAADLARRLDCPAPAVPAVAAMRAWNRSEGAPGNLFNALEFLPANREVLEMAEGVARAAPHSAAVALHHARRLLQVRELRAAAAEAERAVQLAPASPRVLLGAAEILVQTGATSRALELRREAERLAPLVHPSLRP